MKKPFIRRLGLIALLLLLGFFSLKFQDNQPPSDSASAPKAQKQDNKSPQTASLPNDSKEICGSKPFISGPRDASLYALAQKKGVKFPKTFVSVVNHLEQQGRLPDCYLTKSMASQKGWKPGKPLWSFAPLSAIGGNRFGNREGRLPASYNGKYREADLNYAGQRTRGADRLVFATKGKNKKETLIFLTTDHYTTFTSVSAQ